MDCRPESLRLITRTSSGVDVNILGMQFKAPDPAGHCQHEPNTTLISIAGRGTASGCAPVPVPCLVLPSRLSCLACPGHSYDMYLPHPRLLLYIDHTVRLLVLYSYCTFTSNSITCRLLRAIPRPGQRSRASATSSCDLLSARADPPEPFSRILSCSCRVAAAAKGRLLSLIS